MRAGGLCSLRGRQLTFDREFGAYPQLLLVACLTVPVPTKESEGQRHALGIGAPIIRRKGKNSVHSDTRTRRHHHVPSTRRHPHAELDARFAYLAQHIGCQYTQAQAAAGREHPCFQDEEIGIELVHMRDHIWRPEDVAACVCLSFYLPLKACEGDLSRASLSLEDQQVVGIDHGRRRHGTQVRCAQVPAGAHLNGDRHRLALDYLELLDSVDCAQPLDRGWRTYVPERIDGAWKTPQISGDVDVYPVGLACFPRVQLRLVIALRGEGVGVARARDYPQCSRGARLESRRRTRHRLWWACPLTFIEHHAAPSDDKVPVCHESRGGKLGVPHNELKWNSVPRRHTNNTLVIGAENIDDYVANRNL